MKYLGFIEKRSFIDEVHNGFDIFDSIPTVTIALAKATPQNLFLMRNPVMGCVCIILYLRN